MLYCLVTSSTFAHGVRNLGYVSLKQEVPQADLSSSHLDDDRAKGLV